jgi:HlyD family secretion protein
MGLVEPQAPEQAPAVKPTSQAAAPNTASARDTTSPLFRHEALQAYQRGESLSAPLQIVPLTSRVVLWTLGLAVACAILVASLGRVEITSRGRGVMRARDGVQPLLFETAGVVREVLVQVGDLVARGQPIARLDSTSLSATLQQAEADLETQRSRAQRERRDARHSFDRQSELLRQRAALTQDRIQSQEATLRELEQQQTRYEHLEKEGLVTGQTVDDSVQVLAEQRRGWLALRDEAARIDQQLLELDRGHRAAETERVQALEQADARCNAARLMLEQTELSAPRAGRVESLMVASGEVIQPGTVVARLVAVTSPNLVTAFVAERDRAFVAVGASVRVELDQLPFGEFGSVAAKITRISSETASLEEMRQALGAASPPGVHFRIDLELGADPQTTRLTASLGSGSLLTVRLPLRERRVISLVFEPIKKWLD